MSLVYYLVQVDVLVKIAVNLLTVMVGPSCLLKEEGMKLTTIQRYCPLRFYNLG